MLLSISLRNLAKVHLTLRAEAKAEKLWVWTARWSQPWLGTLGPEACGFLEVSLLPSRDTPNLSIVLPLEMPAL